MFLQFTHNVNGITLFYSSKQISFLFLNHFILSLHLLYAPNVYRYTEDMEEEAAIALVRDSIRAGIFNDLGSGSNVDVTVIRKDNGLTRLRTYENAAGDANTYKAKYPRPTKLTMPKGTTVVIEESYRPHKKEVLLPAVAAGGGSSAMDM